MDGGDSINATQRECSSVGRGKAATVKEVGDLERYATFSGQANSTTRVDAAEWARLNRLQEPASRCSNSHARRAQLQP